MVPYRDSVTLDFNMSFKTIPCVSLAGPYHGNINLRYHGVCHAFVYGEPRKVEKYIKTVLYSQWLCREPHRMTRVDFSFAGGNAQYRVERFTKMVAKKRVVQGMRWAEMLVLLYMRRKDGEWKVIATSAAAIRDTIQQIIPFHGISSNTSCAITSRGIPRIADGLWVNVRNYCILFRDRLYRKLRSTRLPWWKQERWEKIN